jgi:hypothetical protein
VGGGCTCVDWIDGQQAEYDKFPDTPAGLRGQGPSAHGKAQQLCTQQDESGRRTRWHAVVMEGCGAP